MKKRPVTFLLLIGIAAVLAASPIAQTKGQLWKDHPIQYEDPKHKDILSAQYQIERMKAGCRLTIRLTNESGRMLSHYWFSFTFKEGHGHENAITDQPAGDSLEMTYESCGVKEIRISEVE